ncbi:hypothetical protein T265_06381 [Opisthorchis viverrini]|uniref:F-box domain-containing protein n=1 Tax=Opisthorchis viverrini TaxID=6198 RepID=A0A074ZGJ3_OPIVI|nr:hypothetical protein T265_06381 [Opisthorchis viverrini]KER26328.1 hypothetical protein T265_06381 [Opisthorchis viverrini]
MSGGSASGLTTEDSDTTDDEDSESSTVATCTTEQTARKSYQDLADKVEKKLLTIRNPDHWATGDGFDDLPAEALDPEDEPYKKTHISALPHELLLRIFRWAVGSHLDTRILGRLARVCRGFYLLACDSSIWRSICLRLWPRLLDHHSHGVRGEQLTAAVPLHYGYKDWRDMAIHRPHVLLDGCYLCRITYVRPGEALSGIYRPMHLVVYYRGIRFYPDGHVNMLTSYHAPNAVVAALGKPFAITQRDASALPTGTEADSSGLVQDSLSASGGGLLQGTYVLVDPDLIVCTLTLQRETTSFSSTKTSSTVQFRTTGHRFKLSSSKKRLHNVLHWDSYTIRQLNTTTQTDQLITLNVFSDQFPECRFSPVRSYVSTVAPEPL